MSRKAIQNLTQSQIFENDIASMQADLDANKVRLSKVEDAIAKTAKRNGGATKTMQAIDNAFETGGIEEVQKYFEKFEARHQAQVDYAKESLAIIAKTPKGQKPVFKTHRAKVLEERDEKQTTKRQTLLNSISVLEKRIASCKTMLAEARKEETTAAGTVKAATVAKPSGKKASGKAKGATA